MHSLTTGTVCTQVYTDIGIRDRYFPVGTAARFTRPPRRSAAPRSYRLLVQEFVRPEPASALSARSRNGVHNGMI